MSDVASDPVLHRDKIVALVSGFWGQNIGNAFFNIGGRYLLGKLFGERNVVYVQDQSGYRTFNDQMKGNPSNSLEWLGGSEAALVVLQGPLLTRSFGALWGKTFERLQRRGVPILLLGTAFFEYTKSEIEAAIGVLRDYPPATIITRDEVTYDALRAADLGVPLYNGIDSAFFVKRAVRPLKMGQDYLSPFITLTFDQFVEPRLIEWDRDGDGVDQGNLIRLPNGIECLIRSPKLLNEIASRGKWQGYLAQLLDQRELAERVNGYTVIRPQHRTNPFVHQAVYKRANALVSDEPYSYLHIYGGTNLTLSDRVHACVATLAYGNPAMLMHPTPRAHLLHRVGVDEIRDRPSRIDEENLEAEMDQEEEFLRECAVEWWP